MPSYVFFCGTCRKEVTLVLTMAEHDRGGHPCPVCGGKRLEPVMSTFFSKTSRKA